MSAIGRFSLVRLGGSLLRGCARTCAGSRDNVTGGSGGLARSLAAPNVSEPKLGRAPKSVRKAEKKAEKKAAAGAAAPLSGTDGADGAQGRRRPPGPEQRTSCIEAPPSESLNPLRTPAIELENVHKVYDAIADHWSHTRYKAWPRVEAFLRRLPPGALVADVGCGNGKNLPAIAQAGAFAIGSDISGPLVRISAEMHGRTASLLVADCLGTPFRGGVFDAVISIAVLHHLSTEARRVQALREGARLLRIGGELLVYCWSFEQDDERSKSRHRFESQDVLVPWSFRTPGIRKSRPEGAAAGAEPEAAEGDAAKLWEAAPQVCQRYCHVYREGELLELLQQVPELEVVDHYFDTGNWCAVAQRRPIRATA